VPALTKAFKHGRGDLREVAGKALKKIDPQAAAQAGVR
jgi:hypothetical protein